MKRLSRDRKAARRKIPKWYHEVEAFEAWLNQGR